MAPAPGAGTCRGGSGHCPAGSGSGARGQTGRPLPAGSRGRRRASAAAALTALAALRWWSGLLDRRSREGRLSLQRSCCGRAGEKGVN